MICRTLAIIGLAALTACGPGEVRSVPVAAPTYINIEVPASLMRACGITAPPSREYLISLGDEAQSVVAAWTLDVYEDLENCAARHGSLTQAVRNFQTRIDELNAQSASAG